MKNWLRNLIIAGGLIVATSCGNLKNMIQSQEKAVPKGPKVVISGREFNLEEIKKELGTDDRFYIVPLGNGYVTSREKHTPFLLSEKYQKMRMLEGLNSGSLKLETNGKKPLLIGKYFGEPSKETLEEIDCIKKDYIITPEEISSALEKKLKEKEKESLFEYASKTLGVPKEEIVDVGEGYVTSKYLKGAIERMSEFYEKNFGPKKDLYNMMSKEDRVINENEFLITLLSIDKTINKLE